MLDLVDVGERSVESYRGVARDVLLDDLQRAAREVAAIRSWPRVIAIVEAALPALAVLILLTGAWLLHLSDGEFAWSHGWVIASMVGLVVAAAAGAAVGPRSAALRRAINTARTGPSARICTGVSSILSCGAYRTG